MTDKQELGFAKEMNMTVKELRGLLPNATSESVREECLQLLEDYERVTLELKEVNSYVREVNKRVRVLQYIVEKTGLNPPNEEIEKVCREYGDKRSMLEIEKMSRKQRSNLYSQICLKSFYKGDEEKLAKLNYVVGTASSNYCIEQLMQSTKWAYSSNSCLKEFNTVQAEFYKARNSLVLKLYEVIVKHKHDGEGFNECAVQFLDKGIEYRESFKERV